jgi:meso-butanediol dehydrogenase/(S,S)-butanediol dehydrogenase/diacetyl reductase
MRLEGKVAVVTGAGGGIGKGIVLRLAEEGADVVLVDLDQAGAQAVAQEVENMGRRALVLPTDVSDATSVNTMVTRASN